MYTYFFATLCLFLPVGIVIFTSIGCQNWNTDTFNLMYKRNVSFHVSVDYVISCVIEHLICMILNHNTVELLIAKVQFEGDRNKHFALSWLLFTVDLKVYVGY